MSNEQFDVIVVGAGPAGSMAALYAAKNGAKTALLEKSKLPREKLCGGGVNAWIIKNLRIPSEVIDRTMQQAQVVAGTKKLPPVPWAEHLAWRTVMRARFDHYLTKLAIEAGAILLESTPVESVLLDNRRRVSGVKTTKGNMHSKVVVGCDGVSSVVAKTAGFWNNWFSNKRKNWLDRCAYCTEAHYSLPDKEIDRRIGNTLYIFYERDLLGYHWIFPKRGIITVGTGCATTNMTKKPIDYFSDFVEKNSIAADLLKGAKIIGEPKGAYVPFSGVFTPSYSDGVLLAGDNVGMVGAVTGEGIYFAVRAGIAAGETAAEAALSNDLSSAFMSKYEQRWRKEIGAHLDAQVRFLKESGNPLKAMGLYTAYTVAHQHELFP